MTPAAGSPLSDGRHVWVPHNRWDLAADRITPDVGEPVAVIVPYFEQPASLRRMYATLAHLDPSVVELVVADDGSSTSPPEPPIGYPLRTTFVRQDDLGCRPGAARNLGAASTTADVLVFLDADTVPEPNTVLRLAAWPAAIPDALAVGRRGHVDLCGWTPDRTTAWLSAGGPAPPRRPDPVWLDEGYRMTGDLLDADDRSYRFVISAVMACHRRLWDDLGGFDPTRVDYGGDDWEFAYRAFNNGAVLVHDPVAVAWHDEPDWTQRDGGSKNAESLWLASVIPEPLTRGPAVLQPEADTLILFHTSGVADGAVVSSVTSLLGGVPDSSIHLAGTLTPALRRFIGNDRRVRTDDPTAMQHQRARQVVTLHRPVRWSHDGLTATLAAVSPGGPGRIDVVDGDALVATVTSTRCLGRARRAPAGLDVVGALFGRECRTVGAAGVTPIGGDVDVAAEFGRWHNGDT